LNNLAKMKRYLILILLIPLISITSCKSFRKNKLPVAQGNAYYVDGKNGSDNNPGTIDKSLKSIKELNLRLKKGFADIYFAGGQTFDGTLELTEIQGPDTHPVKISSWGEGRAVINGGNAEAILVRKCQNIWISDIDIRGNGRKNGNLTNGLSISHSSKCMIENLKAAGFQKSGVDVYNGTVIVLKNIYASDNGFCGINVMGSARYLSGKIRIQDCKAENNPGDPTNLDNHSGNGILVGVSDGVTIDHCSATNNGWDMPRVGNGPVGIWTWESDHITIQYCISYRNKTSLNARDGGGFDLDGGVTNSIIQYCLSYENQGAGYGLFQYAGASPWSKNVIRYCVSINDGQTTEGSGSFFIWNGSNDKNQLSNCLIYNNVAYNSKAPVISFENSSAHKDFVFSNNIFLASDQLIAGVNSGTTFLGNDWWNENSKKIMTYDNLINWAKATGQEMMKGKIIGMQLDPNLKGPFLTGITDPYQLDKLDGYTLKPGSPLKNKGLDPTVYFNVIQPIRDFYGNPVPLGNGNEPGIYEMK
jgi:hypothetical protein